MRGLARSGMALLRMAAAMMLVMGTLGVVRAQKVSAFDGTCVPTNKEFICITNASVYFPDKYCAVPGEDCWTCCTQPEYVCVKFGIYVEDASDEEEHLEHCPFS